MKYSSLFAVDPSLTSSGWALFSVQRNAPIAAGIISPPGTELSLAKRLETLQQEIRETLCIVKLGQSDLLVCEGPAHLVLNPNSALKVERVRSTFETVARELGVCVPGRLNPRTVQSELLGFRGRQVPREQVKKSAREVALRLFAKDLKEMPVIGAKIDKQVPQDIIDALLVGSLACSRIKHGLRSQLTPEEVFLPKARSRNNHSNGTRVRWSEKDLNRLRTPKN
jgi:Holliday junction resolvasome RuvABC endonuclease subunit